MWLNMVWFRVRVSECQWDTLTPKFPPPPPPPTWVKQLADNVTVYLMFLFICFQNPAALMNLGAMLHMQGKLDEAEKSYTRALELKPGDKLTQENLGKLRSLQAKRRKTIKKS